MGVENREREGPRQRVENAQSTLCVARQKRLGGPGAARLVGKRLVLELAVSPDRRKPLWIGVYVRHLSTPRERRDAAEGRGYNTGGRVPRPSQRRGHAGDPLAAAVRVARGKPAADSGHVSYVVRVERQLVWRIMVSRSSVKSDASSVG